VGWLEEEFDAIGVPFAERGRRTDDHVGAMRALWTEEKASFHGEFTQFDQCISRPQPVQGTIPVHIGGHTDIAAKRAGRLGDGFFPGKGTHEELARSFDLVRRTAVEHGRDPDAIEMTTGGRGAVGGRALDEVKALADIGTHRVILPAFLFYGDPAGTLARYGDEVISRVS
jgi:alkanesulfonate monooxygenase SsuD/methylene tetrahydromethanopterin reductase-like flavin-dependent oxidoreductase (luciferase family)